MKKQTSLQDSPRYKNFIQIRDEALERMLNKYLEGHALIMDRLWSHISDIVNGLPKHNGEIHVKGIKAVEDKFDFLFTVATESAIELFLRLRQSSYILAHAGEVQAIARSIGKPQKASLGQDDIFLAKHALGFGDAPIEKRITLIFNRLKRNVLSQLEMAIVLSETPEDALNRIKRVYPKEKTLKRPPKALRSLKEADVPDWLIQAQKNYLKDQGFDTTTSQLSKDPATELTTGIIDPDAWDEMVQDYKSNELPETTFSRGTQDFFDDNEVRTYDWELENEMMNDFVRNVRDGQVDAANENGITDFVWITVSHKTLCEHCEWRDGLTSTEIEEKLNSEQSDDDYDTVVPPAHPNCYCKLAPVTKELLDLTPDDSVEKEFDQWLKS